MSIPDDLLISFDFTCFPRLISQFIPGLRLGVNLELIPEFMNNPTRCLKRLCTHKLLASPGAPLFFSLSEQLPSIWTSASDGLLQTQTFCLSPARQKPHYRLIFWSNIHVFFWTSKEMVIYLITNKKKENGKPFVFPFRLSSPPTAKELWPSSYTRQNNKSETKMEKGLCKIKEIHFSFPFILFCFHFLLKYNVLLSDTNP